MPDLSIQSALVAFYCYRFHGILGDAVDSRYWQKRQGEPRKSYSVLSVCGCECTERNNDRQAKILVNWKRTGEGVSVAEEGNFDPRYCKPERSGTSGD
jgi:hypothetical protein